MIKENYHSVIGFVVSKEKYPCFAYPYFVDADGIVCMQEGNDKIEKKSISLQEIKKCEGRHNYNGVSYLEKDFFNTKIYVFAYSDTDFCIGRKEEVAKFLEKTLTKHKRALKNPFLKNEILEFVGSVKKEKLENIELSK